MDWLDLLAVQGPLKSFLQTTVQNINSLVLRFLYGSKSHIHTWLLEKPQLCLHGPLSVKECLCFFNMLSRLIIAFLPRSKRLLISWLQSTSAVILEPRKMVSHCFHCLPHLFAMNWWEHMPWTLLFECCFKPAFSLSLTFIKRLFSSSSLSASRVVSTAYLKLLISLCNLDSSLCFIQSGISYDVLCIQVK